MTDTTTAWTHWLELPDLERRRAVFRDDFWSTLNAEQRESFLVQADWQELRHNAAAREEKLKRLAPLEKVCEHLGLDHVKVYWLMSTRKLPGWLVGGAWKFDLLQVDRWVEDMGGRASVHRDIAEQISAHRAAQSSGSGRSRGESKTDDTGSADPHRVVAGPE